MVHLTQLPPELLHHILTFVDPADLGPVLRTCRTLYSFIHENKALYRELYYSTLDDPLTPDINFQQELQDLIQLQHICSRPDTIDKRASLPFVYRTTLRLLSRCTRPPSPPTRIIPSLTYPPSLNASLLTSLFSPPSTRTAFLTRSFLYDRARGRSPPTLPPSPLEIHQQSAKLHCFFGAPILKHGQTRWSRIYPFACSKVYDLREYTEGSGWGPFWNDGSWRVDWEKVEAVMLVLRMNIRGKGLEEFPIFGNFWGRPFGGCWEGSYVGWDGEGGGRGGEDEEEGYKGEEEEREEERRRLRRRLREGDPFGVSGTWLRVVCFLDYNDFYRYNFPVADELPVNMPRPAVDVGEATRLILMKIHITMIEMTESESPIVHFKGISRPMDGSWDENANSQLRGTVQYTPEGEVRWTTYSIFGGEERWKSEGIQIGGTRSARGVVGNWFDKDFDPHGPCGPTAFWKISDHDPKHDNKQFVAHDFLPIVDGFELDDYDDSIDFANDTSLPDMELDFTTHLPHLYNYNYDNSDD